jgi:hypothetical protein
LSPDEAKREKYRQTYFKPQVNAVLLDHKKPQIRKRIPQWSLLEPRLRESALSVNKISALRDSFSEGWKTWDGSAFAGLPEALQSITKTSNVKAEPASPTSAVTLLKTAPSAKVQQQNKDKPMATPRPRKKTADDHYDSEEGEWTAAKSVSQAEFRVRACHADN